MNVLVTGGAGYIGSHAALRLLETGHAVTIVDDLSRGRRAAVDRLEPLGDLAFVETDIGARERVAGVFRDRRIDLVMHFGALAYVGESVEQPLRYYRSNAAGTLAVLEAMEDAGVTRIVFSSTCATYGAPSSEDIPITEDCPPQPINPYGRSKLMAERMVTDLADRKRAGGGDFAATILRYFNVTGCDPAGRLGEDHRPETHLVPICLEAALGGRPNVSIFGTDYATPDGTCIRDYVHVDDLIDAHLASMEALAPGDVRTYNVGTGRGHSVREVVDACRRVTGVDFDVTEAPRRPGDPPVLYADPSRIGRDLGWTARRTDLDTTIADAWRWKREHPNGYE
ncbi:MAG: UDP-glucose 4-epimerase GalE [Planctomycetes bacterium]|nr:UDP-glucose 4-epimerase GalE [Planctomycetota bacterium]